MTNTSEQPTRTARSGAAGTIMVTTAILGGCALLATGTSAAVAAAGAQTSSSGAIAAATSLDAAGVTGVSIDASAADFSLQFGDVPEATLEVSGPRSDQWSLRRDNEDLVVDAPRGIFNFCFGFCVPDKQTVVLTLPLTLAESSIDVDAALGAGALRADGDFGDLNLELSAGRMTVAGSARSIDLEMSAGNFTGELDDVSEANFTVSAGSADVRLAGTTPGDVTLEVSAGSLDLTLPDEAYRVNTEVSAGSIDNQLRTDPSASNVIDAEISAGKIVLRPAR